jgi:hypothetical protein
LPVLSSKQDTRMETKTHESPSDRRGSCRYSVDRVPAWLGWWDMRPGGGGEENGAGVMETDVLAEAVPRRKGGDASTYAAIMGRSPAYRGRSHPLVFDNPALVAAKLGKEPAGAAREEARTRGKALAERQTAVREKRQEIAKAAAEPQMLTCRARILDISQTGISVLSEAIPLEGQPVWVRLDGTSVVDWVEGSVRGVTPKDASGFLVRLAFRQGCPYDFFKVAVYGEGGR